MSDTIILIAYLIVGFVVLIPKRTRPLILFVLMGWFIKEAILDYRAHDAASANGLLIISAGLVANIIRNRKKYIDQLKGLSPNP